MADWSTVASLATAGGTLVLAIATFSSVRSANRSARIAEEAFAVGVRPVLMPSRLEDNVQKVFWVDNHVARVPGGRAMIELVDNNVYLSMSLRNVGAGIAVLQGWRVSERPTSAEQLTGAPDPASFRLQSRDLYVPTGEVTYWQAALRQADFAEHPDYVMMLDVIHTRRPFAIDLLYSDHEGGQRTITRFSVVARGEAGGEHADEWMPGVVKHWNLDRTDPR